ncbi:MAG: hypothetical protein L3J10_09120 [Sulfurimonas sp.]|nr:hypothetical protein [Sulfurimonas sp.]
MKNSTNKKKYSWQKITVGIVIAVASLYILVVIGRIISVFPHIEAHMTNIEGYFLFAVLCCIFGIKFLLKINKEDADQVKDIKSQSPTEEKQ